MLPARLYNRSPTCPTGTRKKVVAQNGSEAPIRQRMAEGRELTGLIATHAHTLPSSLLVLAAIAPPKACRPGH